MSSKPTILLAVLECLLFIAVQAPIALCFWCWFVFRDKRNQILGIAFGLLWTCWVHAQGPIPPVIYQPRSTNYLAVCAGSNGVFSPWSNEILLANRMQAGLTWEPSPTPGVVYFLGAGRKSGSYTATNCVGRTNSLQWPLPSKPVHWGIACDGMPVVCWSNATAPAMYYRSYQAFGNWVSISASTDAVHFVAGWRLQQTTNGSLTFTNS